jgi:hypothetical protein
MMLSASCKSDGARQQQATRHLKIITKTHGNNSIKKMVPAFRKLTGIDQINASDIAAAYEGAANATPPRRGLIRTATRQSTWSRAISRSWADAWT